MRKVEMWNSENVDYVKCVKYVGYENFLGNVNYLDNVGDVIFLHQLYLSWTVSHDCYFSTTVLTFDSTNIPRSNQFSP